MFAVFTHGFEYALKKETLQQRSLWQGFREKGFWLFYSMHFIEQPFVYSKQD